MMPRGAWTSGSARRACKEGSVLLGLSVTVISSAAESRTRMPPARKAVKEKQMASWCSQS